MELKNAAGLLVPNLKKIPFSNELKSFPLFFLSYLMLILQNYCNLQGNQSRLNYIFLCVKCIPSSLFVEFCNKRVQSILTFFLAHISLIIKSQASSDTIGNKICIIDAKS